MMKNTPLKKLNIALLGYGRMGKEIEAIAAESGHNICLIIDNESDWLKYGKELSKADVAIDFSLPKAATSNIKKCFTAKVPIVVGTTGWYSNYQDLYTLCLETDNCLFHATNFSLGVNIFSAINSRLAEIMNQFPDYSVCLSETHHTEKLDAPSGTAISLAENIIKKIEVKKSWALVDNFTSVAVSTIPIKANRIKNIPGTHLVSYTSDIDEITISHQANSRKGFAKGAVLAAEWVYSKKGVYTMNDLLAL